MPENLWNLNNTTNIPEKPNLLLVKIMAKSKCLSSSSEGTLKPAANLQAFTIL